MQGTQDFFSHKKNGHKHILVGGWSLRNTDEGSREELTLEEKAMRPACCPKFIEQSETLKAGWGPEGCHWGWGLFHKPLKVSYERRDVIGPLSILEQS